MKFNIPKINEIKEKVNNVKEKIKKTKENKTKIQPRYYGLLFLMILLGVVTVANNIKTYNDITSEKYVKYELPIEIEVDEDEVELVEYETAISSISTNVSNIKEEVVDNKTQEDNYKSETYIWPISSKVIREYSKDSLIYSKTMGMWLIHNGIDIKAVLGDEVKAIADGQVISINSDSFYGNVVKIKHKNGYVSIYAGLANIDLPELNKKIVQGECIGKVGNTVYGESEEETHIHFEITKDGANINPEEVLNNQ